MAVVKKSIQLTTAPFNELVSQGTFIDYRLDEPQWSDVRIEDRLEFWEDLSGWDKSPQKGARKITTKVMEIFKAKNFRDLIDLTKDDYTEEDIVTLESWWSQEAREKYGVKAFKVCVV